jgi:uncharacterized protein YndB with AHSA1/START domain
MEEPRLKNKNAKSATADREIGTTRILNAPRELVFKVWTEAQHVALWWGPNGFTNTIQEMSVTPGGIWRFIMHGPDGTDYPNVITFLEVKRPELLVYNHGSEEDRLMFHVTVTFEDLGQQTRLTMTSLFRTAAEREEVVRRVGAVEGLSQTLGRLGVYLADQAGRRDLVKVREFAASLKTVFNAWIDPKVMQQWFGPKGFTVPVCEIDPRPGGAMRIHMRGPDGTIYPSEGVILEITESELIIFSSGVLDPSGQKVFEVINTITFFEKQGRTIVTVHASVSSLTAAAAPYLAGMDEGWSQTLARLGSQVTK